jgi:hypothetical protein
MYEDFMNLLKREGAIAASFINSQKGITYRLGKCFAAI